MNDRRHERPRVNWEDDKIFENETCIVQVSKLPLRYPKYSVSLGAKNRDGKPMRFIPVFKEGQGLVRVRPILADLRELIDQAESYIQWELQKAEDCKVDDMQRREVDREYRASRGGPQQRPGLKELSKRDVRRRRRQDKEDGLH